MQEIDSIESYQVKQNKATVDAFLNTIFRKLQEWYFNPHDKKHPLKIILYSLTPPFLSMPSHKAKFLYSLIAFQLASFNITYANASALTDTIGRGAKPSAERMEKSLLEDYGFKRFLGNNDIYRFNLSSIGSGANSNLRLDCISEKEAIERQYKRRPGDPGYIIDIWELIIAYRNAGGKIDEHSSDMRLKAFAKFKSSCPLVAAEVDKVLMESFNAYQKYQRDRADPNSEIGKKLALQQKIAEEQGKVERAQAAEREKERQEIEAKRIRELKNRIDGYKDFKFGFDPVTVEKLKDVCTDFRPTNGHMLAGFNCYPIAGARRSIGFTFHKNGLDQIKIHMGRFSENLHVSIAKSLHEKYKPSYEPSSFIISAFDSGKIKAIPLFAFQDWSVAYIAERADTGEIYLYVLYLTDDQAKIVKTNFLQLFTAMEPAPSVPARASDF